MNIHITPDCVVCEDAPSNMVIDACRHCCLCTNCSKLILERKMSCPLCRGDASLIWDIKDKDQHVNVSKVEPGLVKSYLERKKEFIKSINLKIEKKKNKDLVLSTCNTKYTVPLSVIHEVFEYYLGRHDYQKGNYQVNTSTTGQEVTFDSKTKKFITIKENVCIHEFPKFFKYVDNSIVSSDKFVKHLEDHIFQSHLNGD